MHLVVYHTIAAAATAAAVVVAAAAAAAAAVVVVTTIIRRIKSVPVSVVERGTWTPDDRSWTSDRQHRSVVSAAFRLLIFEWWTRRQSDKLDKLPEYLRDTVDWFMG